MAALDRAARYALSFLCGVATCLVYSVASAAVESLSPDSVVLLILIGVFPAGCFATGWHFHDAVPACSLGVAAVLVASIWHGSSGGPTADALALAFGFVSLGLSAASEVVASRKRRRARSG